MSAALRVVSLEATNIKRLRAVHITPEGDVVDIGGANNQGKSSVLDSIMYALGGKDAIPAEPIRNGETDASIVLDLGDVIVTRLFTRESYSTCRKCGQDSHETRSGEGPADHNWDPIVSYTETNSTLTVKSRDGARYPSPQAMLDKLLGDLTFDPREFAFQKPKDQLATLESITKLDTKPIDRQRADAVARRSALKKQVDAATVRLNDMPAMEAGVPVEELSLDALNAEMTEVERLQKVATDVQASAREAKSTFDHHVSRVTAAEAIVENLKRQLAEAEAELVTRRGDSAKAQLDEKAKRDVAEAAVAAVPASTVIREKLAELVATNAKVRANAKRRGQMETIADLEKQVATESGNISALDEHKRDLIAAVKFPVEGLGFGEEGVLLNGLPFEQASTSEQLTVSVAIGIALNPKLRVLLVRNGESLDSKSMKTLAELAAKHDAQLWVERMTEAKDGATVMIEDGSVV
jgi:hypothetical protein